MGTLASLTCLLASFIGRVIHSQGVSGSFTISPSLRAKFVIESCFQYFVLLGLRRRCLVLFLLLILLSVHVLSHLEESVVFLFRCCLHWHSNVHGWFYLKRAIQYFHRYFFIILGGFYVSGSQLINMSLTDKL